ncbi:MAG: hypothetical protein IKW21_00595 [Lachnospiraceae bacterium]|nr:hypothetical protein [Lachnospiraceae bacterium]
MGIVTSGVFPVNVNQFEINTGSADSETWVTVAELEEINVSIENNTETWKSFAGEGWDSALVTGKSAKIDVKGKRCVGDAGNDFIAEKLLANGQDAYISARITIADGKVLTWDKMACAVANAGTGGKATDVGALEATLTGHGKPVLTTAK